MPHQTFSEPRLTFDHPPIASELVTLLDGRVVADLRCLGEGRYFEIAPVSIPVWFLLPGLIWFGLLVGVAPIAAPLWGGEFMGAWRWLALVAFTWFLLMPVILLLFALLIEHRTSHDAVAVVDTEARELHLPHCDRRLTGEEVFQFVELSRWCRSVEDWRPVHQVSVVARLPEGRFELLPIVTQLGASRSDLSVVTRLVEVFSVPVVKIQLDQEQSKALEDC
ncbi:MAG: hypothetical protein ACR2NU_16915 [Aeoliella sp.]